MKAFVIILLAILCCSSCEKILFEQDFANQHPMHNFEYLWQECHEKYAYFELKNVDWEQVKIDYAQQVYAGMSEDSLFDVLGAMLNTLQDDHCNLFSDFKTSFYGVDYLSQKNFDWRTIVDYYITPNHYLTGPFSHNFIHNNELGYLRLSSFSGAINDEHLDFVLQRYQDTRGLILDLRENGGGAIPNVFALLRRLIDNKTLVYYSRIKKGIEHNDFTSATPVFVQPFDGIRYDKPVAILTDRGTYSSGSLLCLAAKALPHLFLVGDTTGGGLGMPNGGQLPNGWTYRFSVTQSLTLDKKPDFEQGVPPDVPVLLDWNNLTRDEILDRAILELL
ncbi:MAG: S41 family peptidase [Aureispira sp.]